MSEEAQLRTAGWLKAADEIKELRSILEEAVPFINNQISMQQLKARGWKDRVLSVLEIKENV